MYSTAVKRFQECENVAYGTGFVGPDDQQLVYRCRCPAGHSLKLAMKTVTIAMSLVTVSKSTNAIGMPTKKVPTMLINAMNLLFVPKRELTMHATVSMVPNTQMESKSRAKSSIISAISINVHIMIWMQMAIGRKALNT